MADRVRSFLLELLQKHDHEQVVVVGHRATVYALDHRIRGVPLDVAVTTPWKWEPSRVYVLPALT